MRHPLFGDEAYAEDGGGFLDQKWDNPAAADRLMLHARDLELLGMRASAGDPLPELEPERGDVEDLVAKLRAKLGGDDEALRRLLEDG